MNEANAPASSGSSEASSSEAPSIVLPVAALVSLCLCWPLGLILSVVALVKYGKAAGTTARTLAIVALVLHLASLPAIAVPRFEKFQCRSKQSEAKSNLKALFVAEEVFRSEQDRYSTSFDEIQFVPRGQKLRYEYRVVEAGPRSFRAEATGTGDMAGDRWIVDENNQVKNLESVCP